MPPLKPEALESADRLVRAVTGAPPQRIEVLAGGYANLTVHARGAGGEDLVLRLFERDPKAARIEAAVLARVDGVVPVPKLRLDDSSGERCGRPALVFDYVEGERADEVIRREPQVAIEIAPVLGAALARLHAIRFARPGFFSGPELEPGPWQGPDAEVEGSLLLSWVDGLIDEPRLASHRPQLMRWRGLLSELIPLQEADDGRSLVHADFNFKNLILRRRDGRWELAAVLDWEFAFVTSPLADLGNLLRFEHRLVAGFRQWVAQGYLAAGGTLPDRWRELAAVHDAMALCEFLRRGPSAPFYPDVLALVARAAERGSLSP